MDKKNNYGLVIGMLVGVVVCLIVVIGLLVTGVINFKVDTSSKKEESGTVIKDDTAKNTDENKVSEDEKYSAIIEEYKSAMNDENYQENMEKYPNINAIMMNYYHNFKKGYYDGEMSFNYTYYDINKDGNNELVVVTNSPTKESDNIADIYTYDGNKANMFIHEGCLGERCSAAIYDNGIIYFEGSGGAAVHGYTIYKIGADGYSKETVKDYTVEYTDLDGKSFIVTNDITNQIENFLSIDELESSLIGSANKVDLSKLDWEEIK